METLETRIHRANELLASYAVPHKGVQGREREEPEDETRFPFQRDRDRIIHTRAFRRLKGKTQVYLPSAGDHHRTRLTHTMEVAQISRDIARTLSLNEDLAECVALAHDLGHPPFGHAGESALNEWMHSHGGRFEHNEQSYRIVTLLEQHSSHGEGLNLNKEVLDGLRKHSTPYDNPHGQETVALSLEAQAVNSADEIAYISHDCDDGLTIGLFSMKELTDVPLAARAAERAQQRGTTIRGAITHFLIADLYARTEELLAEKGIHSLQDVYACSTPIVALSPAMRSDADALRSFLEQKMYFHPLVADRNKEGQAILRTLCNHLYTQPTEKILELQKKNNSELSEAVKDYVAGMTDEYATKIEKEVS